MDAAAQWPEGNKSMEEKKQQQRPQKPPILNCPRCNSTHTKFCYYNNYSLTQPRYFCKTCRRYWTEGGSLRNVPVGGGSRKNKRPSSSSPSTLQPSSSSKISKLCNTPDDHHHIMGPPTSHFSLLDQNPNKINNIHEGQDLNLGYPQPSISEFTNLPFNQENKTYPLSSSTSSTTSPQFSAMEFLKSGIASRGFMSSFISMPMQMPIMPVSDSNSNSLNNMFSSSTAGIPFQEFKPSLNFSLDGFDSGYNNGGGSLQGVQENGNDNTSARLFFPFEELKPTTNEVLDDQQNRGQDDDSNGYWNGGGSW